MRRVLTVIPILLGVSIVTFLLVKLIPGDITLVLLGPWASPSSVATLRELLGLDQPIHIQYIGWLTRYLQGDFGMGIVYSQPVSSILGERVVNSMILTSVSITIAVVFGFLGGVFAAVRRFSIADRASTVIALTLASSPTFWLGLLMLLFFSLEMELFPTIGMHTIGESGILDLLWHIPLPAFAAAFVSLAVIFRLTRSEMVDALGASHIVAARARGIPERSIVFKHALRNILAPVVNISGLQIGYIFGASLFAEIIFRWPGVGLLMYNSILARDVAVIQAVLLVMAVIFIVVNFSVDIFQALLDPRSR